MSKHWGSALVAATIALGAQGVAAQPMNGCPAGQAMQSSSPSGNRITCVPVASPEALQAEVAARQAADAAEAAARQAMDANILGIIGGLAEADIVGRWATTGSTMCLQSTNGFSAAFMSPQSPTNVSQLYGTASAVRTFRADGTGSSVGVTQSFSTATTPIGPIPAGGIGGANVGDLNASFTWRIDADGRLVID